MKRLIPALLLTGALGLLFGQELRQEFHQTYSLAPNGRVVLKNVNGSVQITGWDRQEVKVDAVKKARTQQALDEARIDVQAGGDRIEIRTRYPEGDRHDSAGVDYVVSVPRTAVLESIGTVNGPVKIENVAGPVKAASVNGDVDVAAASGDLELDSVNGRVHAGFVSLTAKEVSMKTVNGGVEVTMPAGAGANVTASTLHGSINSDFEVPVNRPEHGPGASVKATIGSGGPNLRLKTVNGSIALRRQ